MYTQNGRALQIGRGNNRSLGFYGVAGVGAVGDSATLDFSQGFATVGGSSNAPSSDSANYDFSQGYAVVQGAPGSSANMNPGFAVNTPNVPSSNTSNTSLLFIVAGVAGLFIMLAGGRR